MEMTDYEDAFEKLDTVFETDRLNLIPFTNDINVSELHSIMSSEDMEEVADNMIIVEKSESISDTINYVKKEREEINDKNKMSYIMRHKDNDEIVGVGTIILETVFMGSIGVWIRKKYWGKEFSSERARKFIEVLFEDVGVEFIQIMCFKENEKAVKSIQKYIEEFNGIYDGIDNIKFENGEIKKSHIFKIPRSNYYNSIE